MLRHAPTTSKIMTQEEIKLMDDTQIIHDGYTRTQLKTAFERVQNNENWKMPTNRIIVDTEAEAKVIVSAIAFYTGCVTHYYSTYEESIMPVPKYLIPATLGYYHYIGA